MFLLLGVIVVAVPGEDVVRQRERVRALYDHAVDLGHLTGRVHGYHIPTAPLGGIPASLKPHVMLGDDEELGVEVSAHQANQMHGGRVGLTESDSHAGSDAEGADADGLAQQPDILQSISVSRCERRAASPANVAVGREVAGEPAV
jgi:hypothetical protein